MRSEEAYAAAKKYTDRRISEAGTGEGAKINDSSISTSETWSSDKTKKTIDEIKREIENETGCVLDVELDKSTYIMKIKLLNKNGEEVSSKCVDFPMETAFVNASFDKQNKDMTFTLESGVTVVVPLGDMVVGLVSQEDFDSLSNRFSELSSNLDDYGLVNQFDGLLQNGDYQSIDGSLIPSQVKVCTVTKIPVKKGDVVTPKAENVNLYYAQAWNTRGEHIGDITSTWTNVGTPIKIQDDGYVTFTFKLADSGNITPQTAGKISVYINNAIDEIKNDLSVKTQNIGSLIIRRSGNVVTINGFTTVGDNGMVGALNEQFRPSDVIRAVCNVGSNAYSVGRQGYMNIDTEGKIHVVANTGESFYCSVSYIIAN